MTTFPTRTASWGSSEEGPLELCSPVLGEGGGMMFDEEHPAARKGKALDRIRFHVETGPGELFARVRQKLLAPRHLGMTPHAAEQAIQRGAPTEQILRFDPQDWELVLAETRRDNGKWQTATWRRTIAGCEWWITVGLNNVILTLYAASDGKRALGNSVIRNGPAYEHVREVNRKLLASGV